MKLRKNIFQELQGGYDKMSNNFENCKSIKYKQIVSYIENSLDEQIIKEFKLRLIKLIFENLDENDNFKNNSIYFDMNLWTRLHKKNEFKNNIQLIHNFVNELVSKSLVHKKSRVYPKGQRHYSVNPINSAYLYLNLIKYQKITNLRDSLVERMQNITINSSQDKREFEINLFIYFKIFIIHKIPNSYFQHLKKENIIYIDNKVIFIVKNAEEKGFIPIDTIIFDTNTSKIIKTILDDTVGLNLDGNEPIFKQKYNYYVSKLDIFCKNNSIMKKEIQNIIEFEYQLNNTSLHNTIIKDLRHLKISLFELDKLFPNSINKELLEIEKKNYEIYRNLNQKNFNDNNDEIEEDDDESDLKTKLKFNSKNYEQLREITKVPTDQKQLLEFYQKWERIVSKPNQSDKIKQMYSHIRYFLDKHKNKEINRKTLRDYLYIIFTFCFDFLVKSENIEQALRDINIKIKNSNLNPNVQKRYDARIRHFFYREYNFSYERIKSVINYNRSIVFLDELNKLINKLIYKDKKEFKNTSLSNARAVYIILAYYTGLRKGELYSRLLKDIYYIEDNKFYISVNIKGVNLINKKNGRKVVSLKNNNAKRKFEFEITNSKHFQIVKEYFEQLKEQNVKFLFPDENKNKTISKHNVIKIQRVNEINKIIQDITNRYTVIHSFRHTYVTNEIRKILDSGSYMEDLYDLIYRVGHSDPDVTFKYYAHLDLYNFKNKL